MVSPAGDFVVAVVGQAQVWRWWLDGITPAERLDDGSADFVFDPYITTCGTTLVWQAWNVPDMPWDASRVQRVTFDDTGRAVEYGTHTYRPSRYSFEFQLLVRP